MGHGFLPGSRLLRRCCVRPEGQYGAPQQRRKQFAPGSAVCLTAWSMQMLGRERTILASMISIERLSKSFETARGTSHPALSSISLDVAEGEFVSILGPSGCGKSTLLYIVGGFVTPT